MKKTCAEYMADAVGWWKLLDISPKAERACANLIIDSVGVALAAKDEVGVVETLRVLERHSGRPDGAAVLFHPTRLPSWEAAFANSAMIHALNFDDVYPGANIHIMSCVLPAALAASSVRRATGEELARSIVLGIETAGRLAQWYLKRTQNWLWLTTSVIGGFGAVVSAGEILGLNSQQLLDAWGIFYSTAGGPEPAVM